MPALRRAKEEGLEIPRPGRGLPIEFAPAHRIAEHPDLARDFFARILELDFDACFISDSSTDNLADIFTRLVSRGISTS